MPSIADLLGIGPDDLEEEPGSVAPPLSTLRPTAASLPRETQARVSDILRNTGPTSAGTPEVQAQLTQALPESVLPRGSGMILPTPRPAPGVISLGNIATPEPTPQAAPKTVGDLLGLTPGDLEPETTKPGADFPVVKTRMIGDVLGVKPEDLPEEPSTLAATASALVPTALRVGGSVAGWGAGVAASPFLSPAAAPIGGAIGAGLGEAAARYYEGGGLGTEDLIPTALVTLAGLTQVGPLPSLIQTMGREAAINLVITTASTLADRGELPSSGEAALATVMGLGGGYLGGRTGAGNEARARAGREAGDVAQLGRLAEPSTQTPTVGQTPALAEILGPRVQTPEATTPQILTPGAQPRPEARIIEPGAIRAPEEGEAMLRAILERRGTPQNEIDRIVTETAPPAPTGRIILPGEPMGRAETAGGELVRREALPDLQAGIRQGLRTGPEEGGPLVLPFRTGEARILETSPEARQLEEGISQAMGTRAPALPKVAVPGEPVLNDILARTPEATPMRAPTPEAAPAPTGGTLSDLVATLKSERGAITVPNILRRRPVPEGPTPEATRLVTDMRDLGEEMEKRISRGNYDQAHEIADQAMANLDKIDPQKISKDNRLYKVVADALIAPGAEQAEYQGTYRGAGQILQRLSALQQRLDAEIAKGGAEGAAAAKLKSTLFNEKDPTGWAQVIQLWRGGLVGTPRTAFRIAADQAFVTGTTAMDRAMTGITSLHPIRGLQEAGTVLGTPFARLGQNIGRKVGLSTEPDTLTNFKAAFPEITKRLEPKQEEYGPITGVVGSGAGARTLAAGKWYIGKATWLGRTQEQFYRNAHLQASLTNQLRAEGRDPAIIVTNPQAIPVEIRERAAHEALRATSALPPESTFGKNIARTFADSPVAYLGVPFVRNIANKVRYITEHSPLGLVRLATQGPERTRLEAKIAENMPLTRSLDETIAKKAQFNIERASKDLARYDTTPEVLGKVLTGLAVPLAAAVTLRGAEYAGEHWWEMKAGPEGKQRADLSPYQSLSQFLFLAEVGKQIQEHGPDPSNWTMSRQDISRGITTIGTRAGTGGVILDMLTGRGGMTWDGITGLAADLAAALPSGFTTPLSPLKSAAGILEQQAGMEKPPDLMERDYRQSLLARAGGPAINNIPGLASLLPERYIPTRGEPLRQENPLGMALGAPRLSTPTPFERAAGAVGMSPNDFVYQTAVPGAKPIITQAEGQYLSTRGSARVSREDFARMSPARQEEVIRGLGESGRETGLRALMRRDRKLAEEVKLRNMPAFQRKILEERRAR